MLRPDSRQTAVCSSTERAMAVPVWSLCLCLLLLVLAPAARASNEKALPASWKLCVKDDPDINSCLKDAMNDALQQISLTGLKELKVFPTDPFKISQLTVSQGTGPVAINLFMKNVQLKGFKDLRFRSVTSDLDHFTIKGPIETLPLLTIEADYKISGRILVLPISGEGKSLFQFKNLNSNIEIYGEEVTKGGQKYMNVTNFVFPSDPELFIIKFENLFNGNKQLSDQMNKVLNENWPVILKELQPALLESFGVAWADTANRILLKVPFSKLFKT